jgi:hypothetical protein
LREIQKDRFDLEAFTAGLRLSHIARTFQMLDMECVMVFELVT